MQLRFQKGSSIKLKCIKEAPVKVVSYEKNKREKQLASQKAKILNDD